MVLRRKNRSPNP